MLRYFGLGIVVLTAASAAAALTAASPALAAAPAALVEEVSGATGVQPFDYVESGRTLALGSGGIVVLGYLKSCLKETITGGTVTIGAEQSAVVGGKVERERVECDGGNLRLTAEQAGKSGVTVFRVTPGTEPVVRVFALSPALSLGRHAGKAGATVVVERIDKPDRPQSFAAAGAAIDLAKAGVKLARGGLYRARIGDDSVQFRIDPLAVEGPAPALSRLVAF
jgi:hypothetical protein